MKDRGIRVIAGSLKGRRLGAPGWPGLRPTSSKTRETLFSVIGSEVAGAEVLDVFAGTGALGIEALSRGAAAVTFVERDRRAARLVAENVERCGVGDRCAIIRADLRRALDELAGRSFGLILVDPPYEARDHAETVAGLGDLLSAGGLLVLEHSKRSAVPEGAGVLRRTRSLRTGDTVLSTYRRAS
jgi:16S rRNA (guanine(966)-N(2))-methyltransferase RsmD